MESFEQIYSLYFKGVYRYMVSLCRDVSEAEEITQETFFQAMKHMQSFRGDCKMTVWLCQIAKHIYFARQRKRRAERPLDEILTVAESAAIYPVPEQRLFDEADAMSIHEHLHHLEEPYKEVFMLRVFGELPFKKIAHIFGKTENWARVTYHRAKIKLINEMEETDGNDFL